MVIWANAVFAGYESIRKLIDHGTTSHVALGITGAALGIVGNQAVARYKLIVGKRINSATLVEIEGWVDAGLTVSSADALGQQSPRLSPASFPMQAAAPGLCGQHQLRASEPSRWPAPCSEPSA